MRPFVMLFLALVCARPCLAHEQDALATSRNIIARHLPFGAILDPIFATPESQQISGYAHGGDAAIWTGHYLAAEAFRYRVTGDPEALDNARRAVTGLRLLVDVTGRNLLARCAVPVDWPFAQSIIDEEKRHGVYRAVVGGQEYYWFGNTSRDQYSGVFFGLGVAYDLIGDAALRGEIKSLVTRLTSYLLDHNWFVVMPDGDISVTFTGHPEQRLSFLSVARRVNDSDFGVKYSSLRFFAYTTVGIAISFEVLEDHNSYFKFNLDTINLYNLIRLENSSGYRDRFLDVYRRLRGATSGHGNAHFNMIDRALTGPDARRDAETRALLDEWLLRPRRDEWLDWRNNPAYPACGADRACQPLPVRDRIRTDFLWQRSPYLLYGGGTGKIEGAGIDYILPYWMARHYGVIAETGPVTPDRTAPIPRLPATGRDGSPPRRTTP
ncbi:MAG: hypothetical protein ACKV2V_02665 [Blastocatellia bacterium]